MPTPSSSPSLLYQSLANAVDTAQGTVLLYLNQGMWLTNVSDQQLLWTIPAGCKAEVQFDYGMGVLISASISFDPPVDVEARGNLGGIRISSITYDRFGDVIDVRSVPTTPVVMSGPVKALVLQTLSYDRSPRSIFLGTPFTELNTGTPADGTFQPIAGPATIVSRVRFTPDAGVPALAVTFKDQAVIKFSDTTVGTAQFNNFVTVRSGTGFQFDNIDYFLDESSIAGSLSNFTAVLERGLFSTANLLLQLQSGASISLDNVDFTKSADGEVTVNSIFGTLTATLTAGSAIAFEGDQGGGPTSFSFDNGSQLVIQGLSVVIGDGHATTVQAGGGSSLQVNVIQGRLVSSPTNYMTFPAGRLNGLFQGTWNSGRNPQGTLQISVLDFAQVSGHLDINKSMNLSFADAVVKSSSLEFNSEGEGPHVTGTITTFGFTILPNSTVAIPGGFQITAGAGGSFNATTPLAFGVLPYPVGQYKLSLPFSRVLNSSTPSFSLTGGQANLGIETQADGTIVGTNCDLQGQATIVASGLATSPTVHLSGLNFQKPPDGDFSLAGTFQATIPAGLSLSVDTPFVKGIPDHDDFRAFPLKLVGVVSQPIVIPATEFSALNTVINLASVTINPTFTVTIPNGLGEHEDSDDPNSADGTHGPDQDQNRQEAVTDTYPGCRVHIYLVSGDYPFSAEIKVVIDAGQLQVDLTQFQSTQDIGFDRDGCDLGVLGAIVGALTGGLLAGPFGSTLGAIVGEEEGQSLNASVNQMIAGGVANYLLNLKLAWHAQL